MTKNYSLPAVIMAIGFILGSAILGIYWKQARANDSFVTVKGLSEREVIADRGWMAVNTSFGSNSLEDIKARMASQEKSIIDYLKEKGFSASEITTDNINIYQNDYNNATFRFNANLRVTVSSTNVDAIEKASGDKSGLISKGVLTSGDKWQNGPKYYYTKFTDVKTEMIAEATHEAKRAAEEFAANSGASVGKIRRANQGIFQFLPGDRSSESAEFYKDKIIRVVSTLDFYLD
ncbi:SIMPL domain-containing protein [Portibacter lacus]|uniref:SIMPL domain-containing protein n=1 Tax=Portibacter lacus TaxID=1099794 RepID=A0AA37SPC5_9BACT|nr:SIMPL domain-containing protein [Portibacter lacus]GLR18413.1 SIMPL domain-containing protein [Portibacter lacus]